MQVSLSFLVKQLDVGNQEGPNTDESKPFILVKYFDVRNQEGPHTDASKPLIFG